MEGMKQKKLKIISLCYFHVYVCMAARTWLRYTIMYNPTILFSLYTFLISNEI